jgi:hypothetical protein
MGVFFQSNRGLELIDPGGAVHFIGQPISKTTAAFPVCTSAVFCDTTSTVRFTMVANEDVPADGLGVICALDIRRSDPGMVDGLPGRWAVHKLTCGGTRGNVAGAPIGAACMHPTYGYVEGHDDGSGGSYAIVSRENTTADPAPWLDFGTYFVPLQVTLAWCTANGVTGWGSVRRVRALCTYYAPHGLNASFSYDFQAQNELHSFNSNVVAGFVNGSEEAVKYYPAQGQCTAIGVTLATTPPIAPQTAGTGQGAAFVAVSYEIHPRTGGARRGGASSQS